MATKRDDDDLFGLDRPKFYTLDSKVFFVHFFAVLNALYIDLATSKNFISVKLLLKGTISTRQHYFIWYLGFTVDTG